MSASPLAQAVGRAPEIPPPRAYGENLADLDLDFGWQNRPALVTTVLAHCCTSVDKPGAALTETMWNLSLGARIVRLLRIVSLTTREERLAMALACTHNDCRKTFEVSPAFADLLVDAQDESSASKIVQFPLGEASSLSLRLPTGRDQATWQSQRYDTPDEAVRTIVQSLITTPSTEIGDALPEKIESLSTAMEEADPLTSFHIATTCPHCGLAVDIAVDLEAVALTRLATQRRTLLRDVHVLATRYGWSETDVLAIPAGRRAEYRQLISSEEDTLP
jgi:hypothetical protein